MDNWILGVMQGIIILILGWIKIDQKDMWRRMNNHYHVVNCDNKECRSLKTGNVIIPGGDG